MSLRVVGEHLYYVFFAVLFTISVGVPIGVCAYLFRGTRRIILTGVSILQTIPSLALIGILMVLLGAGKHTIIIGLMLYSLLPVVQNTYVGLNEVEPALKEAALGMGMTRLYRLIHVEMPIAFPLIFTGIRIATVTSVGVAVFAAFVGGGGLGNVIYRGIRVQDMQMILTSTASLMTIAVVFDLIMAGIEKRLHRR